MNYSTLDDRTLMQLIARAHAEALSELYDRYHRLLFSLALNIVGDRDTAEEITLDVFTRVWQKAGSYRGERAKVSTWLTSITRYQAIDVLRRQGARPEQHSVAWAEVSSEAMSTANGPEERAEHTMRRERVRAAVAQLPPDQQQVLALAYFKGYSHRQIAEVLDQPLGTIKTRIRLAMQKLRQQLRDEQIAV